MESVVSGYFQESLQSLFSTLALVIAGFHIALNWDWILGVARNRQFIRRNAYSTAGASTIGPTTRVAFGGFATTLRRLVILGCIAFAVSVSCFALVELFTQRSAEPTQLLSGVIVLSEFR